MERRDNTGGKIAFLFLTRAGLHAEELWSDFFRGAPANQYSVYAHTKTPPPEASILAARRIRQIIPTEWGTVSLVRATLALLRAALEDEANVKFVLLSESCVPLLPFARIYNELSADERGWMAYVLTPEWMIHQKGPTRDFVRWNGALRPIVPTPAYLLKQQQWMVFNRPLAQLHVRPEADLTALWEGVFAPDEHYFANVTPHELHARGLSPAGAGPAACLEQVVLNRRLTHVEWGVVGNGRAALSLQTLSAELLRRAREAGCLFLRKVAPGVDVSQLRASWAEPTT